MIQILFLILSLILSSAFGYVEVHNREFEHIPGEYLITYLLNTTVSDARNHVLSMANLGVEFIGIWNTGFHKGFAGKLSDEIVEALQHDPMVMSIEANMIVRLDKTEQSCDSSTANALSWGLSRVSYSGSLAGGLPPQFIYPRTGGSGTTAYIADTGILTTHDDFDRQRASFGVNYSTDVSNEDGNGHGTHCAGTVGGLTYGVAKDVKLVAVKVLSAAGSGSFAGIVNGINWVSNTAIPYKSVVSMSLGGTGTQNALKIAIDNAVDLGIAVVVSAGNSNGNACNQIPAQYPSCITVGSTAMSNSNTLDARSSFSNFGTCVDIFAPGTNIRSAWIGSNTATNTISGTSMACPHVSGLSATILATENNITPDELRSRLVQTGQKDLISNVGANSPNVLAYNGCN